MIDPTCGCCVTGDQTPLAIDSRPGLQAIAYRVGTFVSFRRTMLEAIAGTPELAALTTRLSDDYAITIMELWAVVADVLTFYQERIANEGYLRTARLRDSVLRMVRLLDYQLAPGAAASSLLAFTVDRGKTVAIPVALRVQSVPAQNQKPQKYETVESITATPFWNKLRIMPAPVATNPLARGNTQALLLPGTAGLAAMQPLAPGNKLVVFNTSAVEELAVKQVRAEEDRIVLAWSTPLQRNVWDVTSQVFRFARVFRIFGHTAAAQYMKATPPPPGGLSIRWSLETLGAADYAYSDPALLLDGRYEGIGAGTRLLVAVEGGAKAIVAVTGVSQAQRTLGSLTDSVTQLALDRPLPAIPDRRAVLIYELQGDAIPFWGFAYPDAMPPSPVYLPGRRLPGDAIEVGRVIERKAYVPGVSIALKDIGRKRRVLLNDASGTVVSGVIQSASIFGANVAFLPTVADPVTVIQLKLSAELSQTLSGVVSAELAAVPVLTSTTREIAVTLGTVGPRLVSLSGPPASFTSLAADLEAALNAADPDPVFAKARVRLVNSRLLLLPGVVGADIAVRPSPNDTTTAAELGFDPDKIQAVAGLASGTHTAVPVLTNPAREMAVTIGSFGPRKIHLAGSPFTLTDAARKLQNALNAGDPSPLFSEARVVVVDDRLFVLPGVVGSEIQEFLRLDLALDNPARLDPSTATLSGNVTMATHGETIPNEVLGDGDASAALQRFTLQKKPLTYVPSADPGGIQSTLQILVNRILWHEKPTLYGAGPNDPIYTTRLSDDGITTVQFGDGQTGARLPSGRANVVAKYRQGSGLVGRVGARSLTIPLDLPVGLKGVTNPLAAEGGADPETLAGARTAAPATVRTFGRAVSLRDFEYLADSMAEIAKSRATWVWAGESRAVHLTIAGQAGGVFSQLALKRIHATFDLERDPNHLLLLDNFVRVPIVITALLRVEADRIASDIAPAARSALLDALSFEQLDFGASVHLSDIYAVLQGVDGVVSVDIDLFQFKDRSAANLTARGATADPLQRRLRIDDARVNTTPPPRVRPAEQAWIENPAEDLVLTTSGGLPG
jgi:hypothetical protein